MVLRCDFIMCTLEQSYEDIPLVSAGLSTFSLAKVPVLSATALSAEMRSR